MKKLIFSAVTFYSQKDEEIFFNWLNSLENVLKVIGKINDIVATTSDNVSDHDLREFLAIFRRYDLDMSQLSQYCNNQNFSWFKNKDKIWYCSVFEDSNSV